VIPPSKPFPAYKWRWATLTPTEGLNNPAVYLGVLRALNQYQGVAPSAPEVSQALSRVQSEAAGSTVRLNRTEQRNLIRNSGQYWKALGLLGDTRGGIHLTNFGQRVAQGGITRTEFAATTIRTLTLPNQNIQDDVAMWRRAHLSIKPLELILKVILEINNQHGQAHAYVTTEELTRIIIPLAGTNAPLNEYVESIFSFRRGRLNLSRWANCTPAANDKRMAREFLLFLSNYGFCRRDRADNGSNSDEKYILDPAMILEMAELLNVVITTATIEETVSSVRRTSALVITERRRVQTTILARPQQSRFRRDVLTSYGFTCLLTRERMPDVLEAGHIVPVGNNGNDLVENGVCLRSDIHKLFDAGHIRLNPNGSVVLSEVARESESYSRLPNSVTIPDFVNRASVEWRWNYY
jgi:hypothetical protein